MRLFLLLLLMPLLSFASTARDTLDDFFTNVATFEADFQQFVYDENGTELQESRGHVRLLRPGRFRWDYQAPIPQMILSDGQFLWIYDEDLAQATVKPISEALGASPILLLSEPRRLDDDFIVLDESEEQGTYWVELKPKLSDTEFELMWFGLRDGLLSEIKLLDRFGNHTVIQFQKVGLNHGVDESAFRFDVPPGTDVIGMTH